ncbi:MAG: outer membrane protein assembly factor BamE domain-containing protein [Rubrivivax sp.]
MKSITLCCLAAALVLAACASPGPADLKPGATAAEITAQMGNPRATFALPNGGKRLEFAGRGARTYMLDVDAAGRLVDATQVLNEDNFRNIKPGMTREQVLMTLGQPANVGPGGRQGGQVWSYHFQNTQCLWFQVAIGDDGRTPSGGTQSMLPACMNAAGGGP